MEGINKEPKEWRQNLKGFICIILIFIMVGSMTYILIPSLAEKPISTFILMDEQAGINVSDSVNVTIYIPRDGGALFEFPSDIYYLVNFEILRDNEPASTIFLDVRPIKYLWILVDPFNKTIYNVGYYLIVGGHNSNFYIKLLIGPYK